LPSGVYNPGVEAKGSGQRKGSSGQRRQERNSKGIRHMKKKTLENNRVDGKI